MILTKAHQAVISAAVKVGAARKLWLDPQSRPEDEEERLQNLGDAEDDLVEALRHLKRRTTGPATLGDRIQDVGRQARPEVGAS